MFESEGYENKAYEEENEAIEKEATNYVEVTDADFPEYSGSSFNALKSWNAYRDNWGLEKTMPSPPIDVIKEIDAETDRPELVSSETAINNKGVLKHFLEHSIQLKKFREFSKKDTGPNFKEFVIDKIVGEGNRVFHDLDGRGKSFGYVIKGRSVKVITIENEGSIRFYREKLDPR